MNDSRAYRYAVYYAPKSESLGWTLGSRWLGRCAVTGHSEIQPAIAGLNALEFSEITKAPRRYGWHATLKAPFALAQGVSESELRDTVSNLAESLLSFDMPTLEVKRLDNFLALMPVAHSKLIDLVSSSCVQRLQLLAAPLDDVELIRRRAEGLTARQDELLMRWGYPYVLEYFRFHMSLTGSLIGVNEAQVESIIQAANTHFKNIPAGRFDSLALFAEPHKGEDFKLIHHFPMKP